MSSLIYDFNQLDLDKTYTYADYLLWEFKERVELLRGRVMKMSPAPSLHHQEISRNINRVLDFYFLDKNCKLFYAPIDVVLSHEGLKNTVVQPDLCVICDLNKIADGKKCVGAPDLVIEILSPGNSQKEMDIKFDLYQESGVQEYWLVYPAEKSINIFVMQNGKFIGLKPCSENEVLKSALFPELRMDLKSVFV